MYRVYCSISNFYGYSSCSCLPERIIFVCISHSESALIVLSPLLPLNGALCALGQACRRMQAFGTQECRVTRIRFSKYLYALLAHENFAAPQHPAFRLPARSSSQFKAHELGMKLVSIGQCTPMITFLSAVSCIRTYVPGAKGDGPS